MKWARFRSARNASFFHSINNKRYRFISNLWKRVDRKVIRQTVLNLSLLNRNKFRSKEIAESAKIKAELLGFLSVDLFLDHFELIHWLEMFWNTKIHRESTFQEPDYFFRSPLNTIFKSRGAKPLEMWYIFFFFLYFIKFHIYIFLLLNTFSCIILFLM